MFVTLQGNRVIAYSTGALDAPSDNQVIIENLNIGETLSNYMGLFFNPSDGLFYRQYSAKTGEYSDQYFYESEEDRLERAKVEVYQQIVDSGVSVEVLPEAYRTKVIVPEPEIIEEVPEEPEELEAPVEEPTTPEEPETPVEPIEPAPEEVIEEPIEPPV